MFDYSYFIPMYAQLSEKYQVYGFLQVSRTIPLETAFLSKLLQVFFTFT